MSKLSKEIKEHISCPELNGKPLGRWKVLNSQQKVNIWNLAEQCEFYEEIADKSMKELTKYKRVFDILKDNINMELICADYDFLFEPLCTLDVYENKKIKLTKEEYELLEELMKCEEDK